MVPADPTGSHEQSAKRRAALFLLAGILALGLGLRLHYALACTAAPEYSDMAYYNELAERPGIPTEAPPGYPLFLRLIYAIGGARNYTAVYVVQSIISAATILLIYLIARRVSGTRAALFASAIAAIYPAFIAYNLTTMTETISVLLVALLLAGLTLPSSERARAVLPVVVLAVSFLFRPVLLLCTPGVFLSVKRRILFLLSFALILGPLISFDLIAGKNALRGARGFYLTYNPTTTSTHGPMKNTELRSNELPSRTYLQTAVAFIKSNKIRFVDIVYRKASIVSSRGTDQYVLAPIAGRSPHAIMLLWYAHIPVLILGVVGIVRFMNPNAKRVALPALSYLLFVIVVSIFKVRYRLPAEPAMIVFAGITLAHASRVRLPRPSPARLAALVAPPAPEPPPVAGSPAEEPPAIERTFPPPRGGLSPAKRLMPAWFRRDWDIWCLILLLALALRFYFSYAAEAPVNARETASLERFVERGRFGSTVAPLYPLFLRGIYAIAGAANHRAVFAVQAAAVAAAVLLLAVAVSNLAGRKAGIVAGILGAILPGMVLMHLNLSPAPFIFLCTAAFVATAASRCRSSAKAALSGLLVGLGVLLAPAFAYFAPGALVVQRRWRLFLLVLAGTLLPYTAFNVMRHDWLEPVYAPSLYKLEISDMLRGRPFWGVVDHAYGNAAVVLSKRWGIERGVGADASTMASTFVAGYGYVALLWLGLFGLARCWRSELRRVFLPPILCMILIVVLSKVDFQDRVVFRPVLIAFAAMLLSGACGGRGK